MSKLREYTEKMKQYKLANPDLTEQELIMHVYLDLGLRFNFDQDFFFGGSKNKRRIYDSSNRFNVLDECMEKNIVICKSGSYILQYVLTELGVNIRTIEDPEDERRYKHYYNIITPADGSEEYSIDLQEDMIYMHYHAFTRDFGLSTDGKERRVISRDEIKRIHTKLGYISKEFPYVDEYIYLFKEDIGSIEKLEDKIDFILTNIDPIDYPQVNYWERRWKHERFIKELLSKDERAKLGVLEFYRTKADGTKEFINGFCHESSKGVTVYMYSLEDNKYNSYSVPEIAQEFVNNGLNCYQKIKGLNKEILKLKGKESR